jgi:mannose/cellobiose epimerase-like protein (N-acyl-D-glucosamine 2-epimerase family)
MSPLLLRRRASVFALTGVLLASSVALSSGTVSAVQPAPDEAAMPDSLVGDTWLRHHGEDLMPYWDMPAALGEPLGNFPSFRGRAGELLPESTNRGLSTLARGVYGYSLAFHLTGEERYLGYARAGLDWILAKGKDPEHGGWYGELTLDGEPVDPEADKDVFDLASLGLAFGMYYNVTRDPAVESELLAVRDLLFTTYYDPATGRVFDSVTHDLSTEVDTGGNGGDITNLLVPGTALLLPNAALLSDPARREQFLADLRRITDGLIARHRVADAVPNRRWLFWGRTGRIGNFMSAQTDFGHTLKSYAMIHNANNRFPDRPWSTPELIADRDTALARAWDEDAGRWNQRLRNFQPGNVEPDSAWWIHAEADQLLAALNLRNGFAHRAQLARSAQTWLDIYFDRDPAFPAGEGWTRIERTGTETNLSKSSFGKNMLHSPEHALILYLHGRMLEARPARLHYALPDPQALTAVAKPYWFDAAAERRVVGDTVAGLPGRRHVTVDFEGIEAVPPPPFPAPDDQTPPVTVADVSPGANDAGWHREPVTLSFTATDDLAGVKEIHVVVEGPDGAWAQISPGGSVTLPPFESEGEHEVKWFAVDVLGNTEEVSSLTIRLDRTGPSITGLPVQPCRIWPPNQRMVQIADVTADDTLSGVAELSVDATADEPAENDIVVQGGRVTVRAARDGDGDGRLYTVTAAAADLAGNQTVASESCTVPHDPRPAGRP